MLAAAAVWAGLDGEATAQGSAAADRAALEAFYDATDGPSWTDDTYWRTSAPPGEWFGVTTDAGGRVTELELPGNGLTGPIPDALGDLALLRTLNLGSRFDYDAQRWIENELTGSIPVALGRLANLRWLSLNGNALVGPIPAWFRSLTNLRALYLDSVGLTGPVPAEFESLANLQTLSLASNGLTGSIPTWLGNLADLRALSLASNGLTGPIPARLGDLANLRRLSLAWNPLTGSLPRTLAGLSQLTTLNIEATAACAPADDEYQAWLASIDFRGDTCNRAPEPVGAVPPHSLVESGPAAGVPMEAYFSDPDDDPLTYSAASSRAGTVTALVSGDTVWLAPGSAGTATVSVTAEDPDGLTAAQTIDVTTIASAGPQNDREVLEVFYDSTGGEGWTNRGNWKTSAPLRDWHGVTTDAAGRVTQLDLGNNDLAGLIPPALGDLTSLRRLTLFYNALTGPIPDELGNLTRLRSLSLDSNELTGSIPARLGNLRLLEYLQLGRNALTGPIPDELGDLGALEGLGLSINELTESIPAWLGNLWRLRWLDLQSNDFTGPIPGRLGSLVNLERLNLSYNWGLTGPLPPVGRFRRLGRADLLMTQACAPAGWFDSETMLDLRARPCETDPDVTIDVAIFHTPGAREAAGGAEGIAAAVDLMVAETNQAYAASGVRHRIRLVESSEVAYEETGNGHLDLGRFREPSDGHMDEVHVVRDRVGADLMHLVVARSSVLGLAGLPGEFGLTLLAGGGSVVAHELGHNMSLRHDRYVIHKASGRLGAHPAYGYTNQAGLAGAARSRGWRTIMSYAAQCIDSYIRSCPTLLFFSNPRRDYNGDPLGVAYGAGGSGVTGPADTSAVLNTTGPIAALLRERPSGANRPPTAVGTLEDRELTPAGTLGLDASQAFADPDGDRLTYTVSSSAPDVVTVLSVGARVTLTAVGEGTATIRVTATDPGGLGATQTFMVTVAAPDGAPFTDDPIVPGVTPVRAVHFTELRTRIDALRSAAGLGRFSWTDPLRAGVTRVRRVHLLELREGLAAAYAAAGRPAPRWTDASPVGGTTPIRAAHLMELRAAVVALQ